MALESTTDVVMDGLPHGDDATHQEEFGHQLDAHEDGSSTTELDGDHCNHCCHAHFAGITAIMSSMALRFDAGDDRAHRSTRLNNLAQAPPTPPPNA